MPQLSPFTPGAPLPLVCHGHSVCMHAMRCQLLLRKHLCPVYSIHGSRAHHCVARTQRPLSHLTGHYVQTCTPPRTRLVMVCVCVCMLLVGSICEAKFIAHRCERRCECVLLPVQSVLLIRVANECGGERIKRKWLDTLMSWCHITCAFVTLATFARCTLCVCVCTVSYCGALINRVLPSSLTKALFCVCLCV